MNIWEIFDKIESGVTNFIDVDVSFSENSDNVPVMTSTAIGVAADYTKIEKAISKLAESHEIVLRCHVVFVIPAVDGMEDKTFWCPVAVTNGQVHFLMSVCSNSNTYFEPYIRDIQMKIDSGNVVFKTEFH